MASDAGNSAGNGGDSTVQERVEELTWALVDEQISDDEFRLLDTLLLSDNAARGTYIDCMQLHTDLTLHFTEQQAKSQPDGKSPVLGFLGDVFPPTGAAPIGERS
jgi:hypothetical protein